MARTLSDPIPHRLRVSIAAIEHEATRRHLTLRERRRHCRLALRAESLRRAADRRALGFAEPVTVAGLAIELARLACAILSTGGAVLVLAAFMGA